MFDKLDVCISFESSGSESLIWFESCSLFLWIMLKKSSKWSPVGFLRALLMYLFHLVGEYAVPGECTCMGMFS